jgi:hypothetical protein
MSAGYSEVVICGAGGGGHVLAREAVAFGLLVRGVTDSAPDLHGSQVEGIYVRPLSDLIRPEIPCVAASLTYAAEIVAFIREVAASLEIECPPVFCLSLRGTKAVPEKK